jgi:hypothetical protein
MSSNPYRLTPLEPVEQDGELVANPLFAGAEAWKTDLGFYLDELGAQVLCVHGPPKLGKTSLVNHLPALVPQARWIVYPSQDYACLAEPILIHKEETPDVPLYLAFDNYETSVDEARRDGWFRMPRLLKRPYIAALLLVGQRPMRAGLPAGFEELLSSASRFDVPLQGFEPSGVEQLVQAGRDWHWDASAFELLHELVGGHPYLVQWISSVVAEHVAERRFVTVNDVDTVIYRAINAGAYPLHYLWEQLDREQKRALIAISRLQERRGEVEDLVYEGEEERWRPRRAEPVTVADVQDEWERHSTGIEFALTMLPNWGRLAVREGLEALERAVENTQEEIEARAGQVRAVLATLPTPAGQDEIERMQRELERSIAALETRSRDALDREQRRISALRQRRASAEDVQAQLAHFRDQEILLATIYQRLEDLTQDAELRQEPTLSAALAMMDALLTSWRTQDGQRESDVRVVLARLRQGQLVRLHPGAPEEEFDSGRYTIAAGILDHWLSLHRRGEREFLRE